MTLLSFILVMAAAMLHAVWNAVAKGGSDKFLSMTAILLGAMLFAIVVLPFAPLPAVESLPYLIAAIMLHFCYSTFLLFSYRAGDFTQVYPIARGTAPLLVAGVSILFLGVHLNSVEILAIVMIGAGILSLCLVRRNDGQRNARASMLAFVTGCFIASYSLVDGHGARLAGTALGFNCWMTIGTALLFAVYIAFTRPGLLLEVPRRAKRTAIFGGGAAFGAYSLVLWAFTQAPIALVTALRETSIVFGLLIGVFVLKEKLDLAKVVSTMVTLLGAVLLRFSKL